MHDWPRSVVATPKKFPRLVWQVYDVQTSFSEIFHPDKLNAHKKHKHPPNTPRVGFYDARIWSLNIQRYKIKKEVASINFNLKTNFLFTARSASQIFFIPPTHNTTNTMWVKRLLGKNCDTKKHSRSHFDWFPCETFIIVSQKRARIYLLNNFSIS